METNKRGGSRKGAGAKKLPYESKLVRVPAPLVWKVKEMAKEYKLQCLPPKEVKPKRKYTKRLSGNP